jgi:hypothetical protein
VELPSLQHMTDKQCSQQVWQPSAESAPDQTLTQATLPKKQQELQQVPTTQRQQSRGPQRVVWLLPDLERQRAEQNRL